MIKFIEYFWIFIIGSFIGFICETIWCLIKNKKIESRKGLIYGCFIPIYGIAALFISLIVDIFNINNYYSFFMTTFIICGIVEYISSVFQEKMFGTRSWDYSNMIGSLNGRINILYLTAFSLIGVLWCKYYKIVINVIITCLNNINLLNSITIISFIFMVYNCFISIVASYRQKLRRKGIKPKNKYEIWLDKKYNDERLVKVYANIKVIE